MNFIFKFITSTGKTIYKSVKPNPSAVKEATEQGGKMVRNPSAKIISSAKPFTPIKGPARGRPTAAQMAERAGLERTLSRGATKTKKVVEPLDAGVTRTISRGATKPAISSPRGAAIGVAQKAAKRAAAAKKIREAAKKSLQRKAAAKQPSAAVKPPVRPPVKSKLDPRLIGGAAAAALGIGTLADKVTKDIKKARANKATPKTMPVPKPRPQVQGPPEPAPAIPTPPRVRTPIKVRRMSDKISNTFGVDGKSKTGSTRKDYMIGWTDGKGGKGPNYEKLKNMKKSEIDAIVSRSMSTTKKSGGKIKKVPIITVGKGTYKGKVVGTGKKTVSRSEGGSVVARQVRGWGKARKPKK